MVGYAASAMRLPLLLLALTVSASCSARASLAPLVTREGVRFSVEQPAAHRVAVAGTFNGWSPTSHQMTRDARRRWTAVVALPPGEHLFMYVVDGAWVTPPEAADFVDDGFGARNGVVVVPPKR
jgi:1,4-alpha-glucan branching enzyme